jgi:hypothetical protein
MSPTSPERSRPPTPRHLRNLVRRAPLEATPAIEGDRLLFIGGLHRSGTSILHRLLRAHPDVSAFDKTGVPQDEGQLLQSVYPAAWVYGGAGRFAFHAEAHLTEASDLVSERNRDKLLREWGAYHDLSRKLLLEKSPPNLIRARFLQALFPGARFVFIVRHPIPVAWSTLKWAKSSVLELLSHWCIAHRILLEDLGGLDRVVILRYEDFVEDPARWIGAICAFAELGCLVPQESVKNFNSEYFARWEQQQGPLNEALRRTSGLDTRQIARFGYSLSQPYVTDWHNP